MRQYPSDIAFTPSVKAVQTAKGSRDLYAKVEGGYGWETRVTDELEQFISERDEFYLATANAEGQPYMQYRGGRPGFLRVIDKRTLAFADFNGNQQYITLGNLSENPKAFIFLMDYVDLRRIKLWVRPAWWTMIRRSSSVCVTRPIRRLRSAQFYLKLKLGI